jgi:uncharacterized protein
MIRVSIERESSGRIRQFHVEGHAFYDEPGKDIVCAGVSAVTVGTVNAVEALLAIELKARMKHGMLKVEIPDSGAADTEDKVQLLLESMVVMLQSIAQSYGEYIALQDTKQARR